MVGSWAFCTSSAPNVKMSVQLIALQLMSYVIYVCLFVVFVLLFGGMLCFVTYVKPCVSWNTFQIKYSDYKVKSIQSINQKVLALMYLWLDGSITAAWWTAGNQLVLTAAH